MDAYAAVIETKRPMFQRGLPVRVPAFGKRGSCSAAAQFRDEQ